MLETAAEDSALNFKTYSGILSINLWNYTIITSIDLKLLISRKCLIGDNEIIQCDNIKNIEYFKIVKSKSLDSF